MPRLAIILPRIDAFIAPISMAFPFELPGVVEIFLRNKVEPFRHGNGDCQSDVAHDPASTRNVIKCGDKIYFPSANKNYGHLVDVVDAFHPPRIAFSRRDLNIDQVCAPKLTMEPCFSVRSKSSIRWQFLVNFKLFKIVKNLFRLRNISRIVDTIISDEFFQLTFSLRLVCTNNGKPFSCAPTRLSSPDGANPMMPTEYSLQYLSSNSRFHLSICRYLFRFSKIRTPYRPLSRFVSTGRDLPATSNLYLKSYNLFNAITIAKLLFIFLSLRLIGMNRIFNL